MARKTKKDDVIVPLLVGYPFGLALFGGALTSASSLSLIVVVATTTAALIPFLAAGNALGFFRFGWQSFGDAFRSLPSRKRTWGVVYDSETLSPLPFAVVRLLGLNKRILEKRVADARGRYAFISTPSSLRQKEVTMELDVEHEGYKFPSSGPGTMDSLLYGNIYRGGNMTVQEGQIINVDVPLDPSRKADVSHASKAPSVVVGVATAAMADAGLWVGLVAVPLAFALSPNPFSLGVLFLFLGATSLRLFGVVEHPFGTVSDPKGLAVPYALLTLHDDSGKRVAFAVSDPKGRYVMAVKKGSYVLSAHTPANVAPPRELERSISSRKGWITQQIIL